MQAITQSQVHDLVDQIPDEDLPRAYRLLQGLTATERATSPQEKFLRLPLEERSRLLAEQSQQLKDYYEQSAGEREEWQAGDFQDDY
jgi:hypothetical protein